MYSGDLCIIYRTNIFIKLVIIIQSTLCWNACQSLWLDSRSVKTRAACFGFDFAIVLRVSKIDLSVKFLFFKTFATVSCYLALNEFYSFSTNFEWFLMWSDMQISHKSMS